MHELSATKSIIKTIIEECTKNKSRPEEIFIDVGELTTYKKASLVHYYDTLKKDDELLKDSRLLVKEIDTKIICNDCKKTGKIIDTTIMLCPVCNSGNIDIIEGKDLIIKKIKIY